jgi:hypothetical protein
MNDIDRLEQEIASLKARITVLEMGHRNYGPQPVTPLPPLVYPSLPTIPAPWWTAPIVTCAQGKTI